MLFSWNNSRMKEPKAKTNAKDLTNFSMKVLLPSNSLRKKPDNWSPLTANLRMSFIRLKRTTRDFLMNWETKKWLCPPPTGRSSSLEMRKVSWRRELARLRESAKRARDSIKIFAKLLITPPTRTRIWLPNSRTSTTQSESTKVSLTNQLSREKTSEKSTLT